MYGGAVDKNGSNATSAPAVASAQPFSSYIAHLPEATTVPASRQVSEQPLQPQPFKASTKSVSEKTKGYKSRKIKKYSFRKDNVGATASLDKIAYGFWRPRRDMTIASPAGSNAGKC